MSEDKFGQTVTASDLVDTSDYKQYGLVIRNGEPVAVPVEKLPKNHFKATKTRKRGAKFSESQVESLGVEKFSSDTKPKTKAKRKSPARKEKAMSDVTVPVKKAKIPKLVPEWQEIREAIRDGRKLKTIAEQYGVRYYDVYRVKVHAMDL